MHVTATPKSSSHSRHSSLACHPGPIAAILLSARNQASTADINRPLCYIFSPLTSQHSIRLIAASQWSFYAQRLDQRLQLRTSSARPGRIQLGNGSESARG